MMMLIQLACLACMFLFAATPQAQPAAPPPADPADALLDRLEKGAAELKSFTADVRYEVVDDLLGRSEVRTGRLLYEDQGEKSRFAILFDTVAVRNVGQQAARREKRLRHYIFDGQWLAEVDPEAHQFIKHQVVPPGKQLDPLKLGEGPFPLPVGQPKAEVLARFDASTLELPADGPLAELRGQFQIDGLRLVPKPTAPEAREYERVDLFYDQASLLPVGIHVVETSGNTKTVRLANPVRNPQLGAEDLEKLRIDDPDPKVWKVSIVPWRDSP